VVVISALGDIEQKACTLGATEYLQKPLDSSQLLATVRRCCA
jgi:FixJ family two-component response regulator